MVAGTRAWGSRMRHGGHWIRDTTRAAIYIRDYWRCCYCLRGRMVLPCLEIDHVWGRSGGNAPERLCTACTDCNMLKRDTPLELFAPPAVAAYVQAQLRLPLPRAEARAYVECAQWFGRRRKADAASE